MKKNAGKGEGQKVEKEVECCGITECDPQQCRQQTTAELTEGCSYR